MRLWIPLLLLLLSSPALARTTDCRDPRSDCPLREIADLAGLRIGAAGNAPSLAADPEYGPALAAAYSSITAENSMKWQALQAERGVWNFAPADSLVALARANGMAMRGHTLVWAQETVDSTPDWVKAISDPDELRAVMAEHIETTIEHFRGSVDSWDVVNEPLATFGTELYDNVFHRVLGPGYLGEAFRLAHAADPTLKLYLNEVVSPVGAPKIAALVALAKQLLDEGVPVHGVGLQGHYFLPVDVDLLRTAIADLAALGLEVEITELDILLRPGDSLEDRLAAQAEEYRGVVATCAAAEACKGVTTWGFTDRYTWIDSFFGPGFDPLPFDKDLVPKPAYFAIAEALRAAISLQDPIASSGLRFSRRAGQKRGGKLKFVSRDPAIRTWSKRTPGDPTRNGATLWLRDTASDLEMRVRLPARRWEPEGRRAAKGYRFRSRGICPRIAIEPGRALKGVCKGPALEVFDAAMRAGTLEISLQLGEGPLQCMRFDGEVERDRPATFKSSGSTPPSECLAP